MVGFSGTVGIIMIEMYYYSSDDSRQIKRWLGIVNWFKGILVKMIKDQGTKFDDFSVSPKIRQILLHWGYKLVESEC